MQFDSVNESADASATGDTFGGSDTSIENKSLHILGKSSYYYTDYNARANFLAGTADSDKTIVDGLSTNATADGSKTNPFVISTTDDWNRFATYAPSNANKHWVLNSALNFRDTTNTTEDLTKNKGKLVTPVTFSGYFYGQGYEISNAYFSDGTNKYVSTQFSGLFRQLIGSSTLIADVYVNNFANVCKSRNAGSICGNLNGTVIITGCQAQGVIYGDDLADNGSASYPGYSNRPSYGGFIGSTNGTLTAYRNAVNVDITIVNTNGYSGTHSGFGAMYGNNGSGKCEQYECYASASILLKKVGSPTINSVQIAALSSLNNGGTTANYTNCVGVLDYYTSMGNSQAFTTCVNQWGSSTFTNCYVYINGHTTNATTDAIESNISASMTGSAKVTSNTSSMDYTDDDNMWNSATLSDKIWNLPALKILSYNASTKK